MISTVRLASIATRLRFVFTALGVAVIAGCSTTANEEPNTAASVEALYKEAREEAAAGGNDKAIKLYERLEGRAAGTLLAQQSQLELAYLYHRTRERALALTTIDRFIKLNPSSPVIDYAMFLRGVINFNDDRGFLGNVANQDLSERDHQAARDAYQSFKLLVDQYPDSRYAPDARVRMDYIVNALADYEVHVARYYYNRGAYLAAANRAQLAVTEYPNVPAAEEALFLMTTSYDKLGLEPLRDDARRVLVQNFPRSRFLTGGLRARERAWWQFW